MGCTLLTAFVHANVVVHVCHKLTSEYHVQIYVCHSWTALLMTVWYCVCVRLDIDIQIMHGIIYVTTPLIAVAYDCGTACLRVQMRMQNVCTCICSVRPVDYVC